MRKCKNMFPRSSLYSTLQFKKRLTVMFLNNEGNDALSYAFVSCILVRLHRSFKTKRHCTVYSRAFLRSISQCSQTHFTTIFE